MQIFMYYLKLEYNQSLIWRGYKEITQKKKSMNFYDDSQL